MRAIILAGGLGTRLQSVVANVPKPMAPIGDKPFLAYLLEYLNHQGITEVILSLHYLPEKIMQYFQHQYAGIKINYVIEKTLLGTGGAIGYVMEQLQIPEQETIFVLNGDTFALLDYKAMYKNHHIKQAQLSIALCKMQNCSRYGRVILADDKVIDFQEKGFSGQGYINAGIYLLSRQLMQRYNWPEQFSFEMDFLIKYCQQLEPQAFFTDNYFIDIGVPEDYAKAKDDLPQLQCN